MCVVSLNEVIYRGFPQRLAGSREVVRKRIQYHWKIQLWSKVKLVQQTSRGQNCQMLVLEEKKLAEVSQETFLLPGGKLE